MRSSPSRSMLRPRKARSCASPKSRPTTATRLTGTKNEAATEKKDALPPSTRSARPKGVSTVSNATLPTTSMAIQSPGCSLHVLADDGEELLLDLLRDEVRGGDEGVRKGARTLALARGAGDDPTHRRFQHRLGGGRVLPQVGDDGLRGHRVVLGVPAVVVRDHGQGRVADLGLPGELGLLQV